MIFNLKNSGNNFQVVKKLFKVKCCLNSHSDNKFQPHLN